MRRRALIFALLYTGVILYLCFYPGTFSPLPKTHQLQWVPWTGRRQFLDAALNFLFYIPWGFAAGLVVGRRTRSAVAVVLAAACLSFSIEWLQMWTPSRYSTYNDWLTNSLGALVGALLAWWNPWERASTLGRWAEVWRLSPRGTLFCTLWLLWFAFPFVPRIAIDAVYQQLTQPEPWAWGSFLSTGLAMASLRILLGPSPWLGVALAAVAAQPLLVDRTLSYAWVAGAAAGWSLAARIKASPRVMGWLLLAWLVNEQFRPWTPSNSVTGFSWIPFATWYDSSSHYYPVIFGKLYLYSTTPWMLRVAGVAWKWSVALPLLILLTGEWAQRYLPGRTPELSDPVLLLAGLALTLLIPGEPEAQLLLEFGRPL